MIDPNAITTVRVGQLPPADFSATDLIAHEVGSDLKQGSVQQLADFIVLQIGASSGLAFRPITVLDGETLPNTTTEEWILVGKGTFYNVNGGANIVTTEELNALMSNGSYWFLGVEIPINVELAIAQFIRAGYTTTSPSEDAVFKEFAKYTKTSDLPIIPVPFPKRQFTADGVQTTFNLTTTALANSVFWNGAILDDADWSQAGNILTLTFTPDAGAIIKPI